jgi:ribosome maturation factor RimP
LPPAPCVFYTEEKNLQGYLVEYNEQDVTIRFPNQTTETISLKNLKDVMMIGIKR